MEGELIVVALVLAVKPEKSNNGSKMSSVLINKTCINKLRSLGPHNVFLYVGFPTPQRGGAKSQLR